MECRFMGARRSFLPRRTLLHSSPTYSHSLPAQKQPPLLRRSHVRPITGQTGVARAPDESPSDAHQAYPLSGYYHDILAGSPYRRHAPTARPVVAAAETQTQPPAEGEREPTPQERMSIVFGTRLAGPGRSSRYNPGPTPPEATWKTINGVAIPPRPEEPDNCCMSGCVHCVWDDFRDEMEEWAGRVAQAKARGGPATARTKKEVRHAPRAEVASASTSMDDDGGGSEANWPAVAGQDAEEDLFANIPVGIREFMKTEKKLKKKHQGA